MIKQLGLGISIFLSLSSTLLSRTCTPCLPLHFTHQVCHFFVGCSKTFNHYYSEKYFAAQSLDNQILIYSTDNFRQNRKKRFAGHSVAGYACQVGFSPDGKWISSGDGEGNVVFWDWKTGRIKSRMKAHSKVVIAHEWLPHETVGINAQSLLIVILSGFSVQSHNCVLGWTH
jgi:WD40 repeat protein